MNKKKTIIGTTFGVAGAAAGMAAGVNMFPGSEDHNSAILDDSEDMPEAQPADAELSDSRAEITIDIDSVIDEDAAIETPLYDEPHTNASVAADSYTDDVVEIDTPAEDVADTDIEDYSIEIDAPVATEAPVALGSDVIEPELEVLDYQTVEQTGGGVSDVAIVSIDGTRTMVADMDLDGKADFMAADFNGDGVISEDEVFDLNEGTVDMNSLKEQFAANNQPAVDDADQMIADDDSMSFTTDDSMSFASDDMSVDTDFVDDTPVDDFTA